MKLIRNNLKFKYENKYIANLFLKGVELNLEKKQYVCLLKLIDFIEYYRIHNISCYKYRRIKFNKPEKNETISKKYYYNLLFKHYISNVLMMIKERKEK
jgi:hypothetical protein